ncbi:MAG: GNAT family N-acetyltransferase [Alphaproteobacteria bacterium]|nr:GNAT family N-acetyltransferase [Alphaproteobacteria bacterium]
MSDSVTARAIQSIADVQAVHWDACADTGNPFVSHAFLKSLEDAGCVGEGTGWMPYHVIIENTDGSLRGAVPMYAKSHSQGEYVFDHGWAHALERAGGRYYPKLQVSSPFSPVTGPRLLARDDETRRLLLSACVQFAERLGVSSLHITFPTFEEWKMMGEEGLLLRKDQQFIWENDNYRDFDDFLNALSSRKRKNIRKERAKAVEEGIEIERVTGGTLREEHWDAFYEFYMDTSMRKWGRPYLNRTFFSLIGERMPDDILLVLCRRAGRYIAGALNLMSPTALFGRNWGCIEDHPFLHFETCYYQAIEHAIENGLERVEAGAQGPHKLSRGYMPRFTYSAHWIADPGFRRAVSDYLKDEGAYVEADQKLLAEHGPFKKASETD